jgi:hypothetical protein
MHVQAAVGDVVDAVVDANHDTRDTAGRDHAGIDRRDAERRRASDDAREMRSVSTGGRAVMTIAVDGADAKSVADAARSSRRRASTTRRSR